LFSQFGIGTRNQEPGTSDIELSLAMQQAPSIVLVSDEEMKEKNRLYWCEDLFPYMYFTTSLSSPLCPVS
jgi:hypothetical protein